MSDDQHGLTPDKAAELRLRAKAKILQRQRSGQWTGATKAHTDWQHDPVGWIVKHLHVPENTLRWSQNPGYDKHVWDGTVDPIATMMESIAQSKDTAVESATGTGKTFGAACLVLWFLACFEDSLVITAAPKEDQLLLQVWKEVGELYTHFKKHFPKSEFLPGSGKLRMKPAQDEQEQWAGFSFVCGVGAAEDIAGRAKGFHREHMLIITEETQSINAAIIKSFDHTRTGDHNPHLALGNPDNIHDELHRFALRDSVTHIRASSFDYPNIVSGYNIVPAAIGKRRLEERMKDYAPEDSRMYLSQLRGICPTESDETLIRWHWCEEAAKRWSDKKLREGPLALGADVADSPTGDRASISHWQGAVCTHIDTFQVKTDAGDVAERLYTIITDPNNPVEPKYVGIDSVGVGAAVVNPLRRMGLRVQNISGGTKPVPRLDVEAMWIRTAYDAISGEEVKTRSPVATEAERYTNLRSQVWWRLREDLRLGRIALPPDEELFKELTMVKFGTPGQKITVEPKDKIKSRLGASPDKADSVAYGNWVRHRSPSEMHEDPDKVIKKGPNREVGLEKLLAHKQKAAQIKQKEFTRALKRMGKARKSRGGRFL